MIINKDVYGCPKCKEAFLFDTSKPFSTQCPNCGVNMKFHFNADCDTERAERVKNMPKYDPRKDPKSPYYIPIVKCPYCGSENTKKISATAKVTNIAMFGIFGNKRKYQWHCNNCKSDF